MAFSVDSVNATEIPNDGGYELWLTCTDLVLNANYRVHLGSNGDATDPACQSGVAGRGTLLLPHTTTLLRCFTPKITESGPLTIYGINIDNSDNDTLVDGITDVLPRDFKTSTYALRKILPPHYATGNKTIAQEPAFSANLVTNGDFTDWTGGDPDDWVVSEIVNGNVNERGFNQGFAGTGTGACNLYMLSSPGRARITQTVSLEVGAAYEVSFDVGFVSGASRILAVSDNDNAQFSESYSSVTTGAKAFQFTATDATMDLLFDMYNGVFGQATIDNVHVRRLF